MFTAFALVATLATAQLEDQPEAARPDNGVELSVRGGYAIPLGSAVSGVSLKDLASHSLPLALDAGYRINQHWFAGVFFQYAIVSANGCIPSASCSGYDLRVAAEGQYHPLAQGHLLDPWVGLGVGYEYFQTTIDVSGGVSATNDTNGLDFAELSAGFDYQLSNAVGVGPWINLSVGQFNDYHGESVSGKTLHAWLSLGVRFTFDLF